MKVGFISDVHGNTGALSLAFRVLEDRGVGHICFIGDAVGYIPGIAAVHEVERHCSVRLKGNHEAMLLSEAEVASGRERIYRLEDTRQACAGTDTLALVGRWQEKVSAEWNSCRVLMVHGSPAKPLFGYVYADTPIDGLMPRGYTHVVCGHTHRPFIRQSGSTRWINCGSVGLPRDDGRFGAAAVLDTETGHSQLLRFDITQATIPILAAVQDLAPEVTAIYDRRSAGPLEGEIIV